MLGGVPLTGAAVATAPGKAILLGEHFVVHGTGAILCAIDRRARVESRAIGERKAVIRSDIGCAEAPLDAPAAVGMEFRPLVRIVKDVMRGIGGGYGGGVEVAIESDIPVGVGLGSSSACCVAAASSVSCLFGTYTNSAVLEAALDAERTAFPTASGADTAASTYGGVIEYSQDAGFNRLAKGGRLGSGGGRNLGLVVADSMQRHVTRDVVAEVARFKGRNPDRFASLCRKESVLISRAGDVLRRANWNASNMEVRDLEAVGVCMSENQSYLEEIGVSNGRLDEMARVAGKTSYGAKITGAGGGGCVIALVDDGNAAETVSGLNDCGFRAFLARVDPRGVSMP